VKPSKDFPHRKSASANVKGRMRQERPPVACYLCLKPFDPAVHHESPHAPTIDHIIPKARGGGNVFENVDWAHRRCNTIKGSLTLAELAERFTREPDGAFNWSKPIQRPHIAARIRGWL